MKKQKAKLDMEKMMEIYKKLATPGEPHKLLARMAGSWDAKVKNWMEPNKPPTESTGTSELKMLLGGRYLQEEFSGEMMKLPFSGIGITGYDNYRKKYVMVWLDSMGTGMYFCEGKASKDGKTITMKGILPDPIRGPMKWLLTTKFIDKNTQLFQMQLTDKNNKKEKTEVTYTRKVSPQPVAIARIFDAPRELVWKAWTDPEMLKKWWGPKGFTTPFSKMDMREGGTYLNCMRSPEGKDYWSTGIYRKIVPQERLVFSDSFADEKGNVVPATYYDMNANFPLEMMVTVTFEEIEGKTKFILKHAGIPAGKDHDECKEGWNQSFDKLEQELA